MRLSQAMASGFRRYFDFSSRSSRSEFWWWWLFFIISGWMVFVLDALFGTSPVFYLLWALFLATPYVAVAVRRLHDLGKTGWWLLIGIIPFIGPIVLLFWFVSPGGEGDNRYGADPLQAPAPSPRGVDDSHPQRF